MPDEQLTKLTTNELVKLALDYPFKLDFLAFDSVNRGIEHLYMSSNVYNELLNREDAAQELINTFRTLDVNYSLLQTSSGLNDVFGESGYDKELVLEALLGSEKVVENLSETQIIQIKEIVNDKLERKLVYCSDFSTTLLFYDTISDTIENYSINNNSDSISDLLNSTNGFTGTTTVTLSNGATYYSGTYSKYGKSAACYKYISGDYSSSEKQAFNASFSTTHPSWIIWDSATKKYNCHSYCWITTMSGSNVYWLNNPSNFAAASGTFSGYGANTSIPSANAYIIIYDTYGPAHSLRSCNASSGTSTTAIQTTTYCLSKLGNMGLYRTSLYDMYLLYDGKSYHVYTEK